MEFNLRSDSWVQFEGQITGKVTRVFNNGFDAHFSENFKYHEFPVYFTNDEASLHPMAVKLPSEALDYVEEELPITFFQSELSIGWRKWIKGENLCVKRSGSYSLEAIEQNSKILQKCMKSLAKDSFVKRDLELKESELASFVRNYENKEILEIPFSIVGKGEGLTPASDDFLCAFLILDRLSGRKKIVLDENWKKKVFQKTTRQSILQYLFAERGLSTLGFEELVKYFLQETVDVKKILHQVNVGHSSGSDMVFGLLSYPWF